MTKNESAFLVDTCTKIAENAALLADLFEKGQWVGAHLCLNTIRDQLRVIKAIGRMDD
jgi:hypothetical protein